MVLVTRGGCGTFGSAAELSGRAQEDTVVSSALQRPFGASNHKAGASLKGLGLVVASLGPPAAPLSPYLVSFWCLMLIFVHPQRWPGKGWMCHSGLWAGWQGGDCSQVG